MLAVPVLLAAVAVGGWFFVQESSKDSTGVPSKYAGTWTNRVQLTNGVTTSSYELMITLTSGKRVGNADIPELTCIQPLNLKSAADNQLTFSLDGDSKNCPTGNVTLSLDGDTLHFQLAGHAGTYQTGSGTLKKTS